MKEGNLHNTNPKTCLSKEGSEAPSAFTRYTPHLPHVQQSVEESAQNQTQNSIVQTSLQEQQPETLFAMLEKQKQLIAYQAKEIQRLEEDKENCQKIISEQLNKLMNKEMLLENEEQRHRRESEMQNDNYAKLYAAYIELYKKDRELVEQNAAATRALRAEITSETEKEDTDSRNWPADLISETEEENIQSRSWSEELMFQTDNGSPPVDLIFTTGEESVKPALTYLTNTSKQPFIPNIVNDNDTQKTSKRLQN